MLYQMMFDPEMFDQMSKEELERRVTDATAKLKERLEFKEEKIKRLEKQLKELQKPEKVEENLEAKTRDVFKGLLESMHFETLLLNVKHHVGDDEEKQDSRERDIYRPLKHVSFQALTLQAYLFRIERAVDSKGVKPN